MEGLSRPATTTSARAGPLNRSILSAELVKTLRLAWSARTGMYFEIPLFALAYFTVLLFIGRGTIPEQLIAPTLIGMIAAMILHQQITRTFWGVLGEMRAGTFERLHLSPAPPEALMLARQASAAIQALTVGTILALLISIPAAASWDVGVSVGAASVQTVVPLVAAVVGGAGLSLMIAGLTLLLRRLEIFIEMIFAAAIIFGGALIPLEQLPARMGDLGRLLFPIAQPIAYTRSILIEGETLLSAQVDWGLAWLIGQPVLWMAIGITGYHLSQRRAQKRGNLARY